MRLLAKILLLLSFITSQHIFAQSKADESAIKKYKELTKQASEIQKAGNLPDSSIKLYIAAKEVARTISDKHYLAKAHINLANGYYWAISDYYKCKKELDTVGTNYFQILTEKEKCKYLSQYGDAIYYEFDYVKSVQYYFKALEHVGTDSIMLARLYHNIGWVYTDLKNYDKGIEFGQKALLVAQKSKGDVRHKLQGLVYIYKTAKQFNKAIEYQNNLLASDTSKSQKAFNVYQMMGIYNEMKKYDSALYYGEQAIQLSREANVPRTMLMALPEQLTAFIQANKMGRFNEYLSEYEKLLRQYNKPYDANTIYALAGKYYLDQKDYAKSKSYLEKAKQLQEEYKMVGIEQTYLSLALWHEKKNEFNQAYSYLKKYTTIEDSLMEEERRNSEKTIDNYSKIYDLENTLTQSESEIKTKNELLNKEKTQKYMMLAGLVFVVLVAIFFFKLIVDRKKMNSALIVKSRVIELKNELLSARNKEVHDSISYAKYLQNAILPSRKIIKEQLKNSFVLYKPKDIVAGDFYWMDVSDSADDYILFAAADCTGHGVPGAMVSVVCSNALNRAVKEFAISEPGKILDKVRELVIETFSKSEDDVKDGMDISLCAYNHKTNQLLWAGANNPLWIVKHSTETAVSSSAVENRQLVEVKPNKQPIGKTEHPVLFTTHTIQLEKGDTFYIFTDGYADQFGGAKGKKLKSSNLKKLLLSIQDKSMEEQYSTLDKSLEDWRGNNEQVDDVCIIGVKV